MKRVFLPIFWKFGIAIIFVVVVFGSINLLLIQKEVSGSLESESEKRGRYISQSLAREAVNPLLYNDFIALQDLLTNARQIDSTIVYAFVLDQPGEVLVHTFEQGVPRALLKANVPQPGNEEQIVLITPRDAEGDIIRDIAVPILQGKLGTVRVGIHEKGISQGVRNTVRVFLTMVVIFLIVGLVGAFVFTHFITSPVKAISQGAERLSFAALKARSQPRVTIRAAWGKRRSMPWLVEDELDLLAARFNGMIARLEEAYAELETAQNSLVQSEKLASVGTLAAGIAHEINNPIAGLQSCIRRIAQDPENIAQNQRYLAMMTEAVDKIERVVRGLLDYTHKSKTTFEPLDCRDVLEKSLLLVSYNLEKARIPITQEFSTALPPVFGDATQLQQVFLNLFLNSIHAIEEKRAQDPDSVNHITIAGQTHEQVLTISVKDTGTGIPAEVIDKIFDPFFSTKEVGRGTGLGLSVCRKIVELHHGSIEVHSAVGCGTTVTVSLPLRHAAIPDDEATLHATEERA